MVRLLPYLVLLLSTPVAANFNCPEGTASAISVAQCYGAGSSHAWPAGTCPTSQTLSLPFATQLLNQAFPDGSPCTQSGYTVSGPISVNENSSVWTAYKRCRNSSGSFGSASPGIGGSKLCDPGSVCAHPAGHFIPPDDPPGVDFAATYCQSNCPVKYTAGLQISVTGSETPVTVIHAEVQPGECGVDSPNTTPSQPCFTVGTDVICTAPGPAPVVTVNDLELEQTVDGTLCASGTCLSQQYDPEESANSYFYHPPSGGAVATIDTPTPPAPDVGTPGVPAPPSITINTTSAGGSPANTYNYWSPVVVAGSTTAPPGGGTDPGDGGDAKGQTCGGPGQPACKVELEGDFTPPVNPEEDGVPTFRESVSNFLERVQNSPIGSAAQNVAAHVPEGGQPPEITFSLSALGDREFTLRIPDPVRQQVETVLPLIMTAVWALIAIRLFLEG